MVNHLSLGTVTRRKQISSKVSFAEMHFWKMHVPKLASSLNCTLESSSWSLQDEPTFEAPISSLQKKVIFHFLMILNIF